MNHRVITSILLGVILSALLFSMFRIPNVSGTITIQPDGTIDPSTAPITTVDNILYTFTDNVNDSIVVQRDDIILDGLGYNLTGSGTGYGVELYNRNNVTIQNIVISNFSSGIVLRSSVDCNVTGNEIVDCPSVGVLIYDVSLRVDVRGNTIVNSLDTLRVFDSTFISIVGNLLTSFENGIYFYQSSNCSVVDNQITCERADDKYGLYLRNSFDNTIFHNNITEAQAGTYIYYSSRNSIQNNSITNCGSGQDGGGVWIYNGVLNSIQGNHISECRWHGISLYRSPNTTISENVIEDNSNRGIMLRSQSDFTQVLDNDIISNYQGIEVDSTHYTIIGKNNLTGNQYHGIALDYASNNTIFSNYVSGSSPGVSIGDIGYNNLTGNTIINNGWGLSFGTTSHNYLADNYVAHNVIGITLQQTSNNTLRNNTLTNNNHNFRLLSSSLQNFLNDVDDSNTVEGKPIYYWINQHDAAIPLDAGCVILVNCSNMTIQNLNLSCNNWQGVFLIQTANSTIEGNNITSNQYGIYLLNASNNQIHENYLKNFVSIQFENSGNNTIHNNTLTGSGNWGCIGFSTSDGNLFYGNNFTDNYIHVLLDEFSVNAWNASYLIGGNYWDNYEDRYSNARDENSGPYQNITGSDGIWDAPWMMNDDNIDNYPIVPEFENVTILALLMVITLILSLILKKHIRASIELSPKCYN